jgi:pyrimidine deaminase RibD-like protein
VDGARRRLARGGRTSPNPQVGCVIAGAAASCWPRAGTTRHAPRHADALAKLGGRARGATLYVNPSRATTRPHAAVRRR